MNLAFNPVTRRTFRANYYSPDVCQPMAVSSGSSSSDSSGSSGSAISGVLDFTNEPKAGPVLLLTLLGEDSFLLTWTSVSEAVYYNVYRSASTEGPFVRVVEGVAALTYTDIPGGDGPFYYYVTALEPAYGETENSNTVSGSFEVAPPLPIVLGGHLWLAPESQVCSDIAGTIPSVPGGPVRFWEDLSGNGNHATMPIISTVVGPQLATDTFDGFQMVDFRQGTLPDTNVSNRTALLTPAFSIPPTNVGNGGLTMFIVCKFEVGFGEAYGQAIGWDGRTVVLRRDNLNTRMSGFANAPTPALTLDATGISYTTMKAYALRFTSGETGDDDLGNYGNEIQLHINSFSMPHMPTAYRADAPLLEILAPKSIALGFAEDLITGAYFGGKMVEVVVFGHSLLNSEVEAMFSYLNAKYPSL